MSGVWAQQGDECPENWYEHADRCYKFVQHPTPVQRARIECQQDSATLVKVHNAAEHAFIQKILVMKTIAG
ncbi:type II antifreeze protein 2 [Elysia marginata]|uniref:Type II antifreeze protein 2 n=1 Tax=Elysia marginata TaxID=1093978 RepID=A0AAV4HU86_9GAST|nr:type II antifreeze protein 2 [Elysia marginata]